MTPMTAAEVRAEVSRLPTEHRGTALRLLASAYDEGISAGLARMPRNKNPFLPTEQAVPEKGKGKSR